MHIVCRSPRGTYIVTHSLHQPPLGLVHPQHRVWHRPTFRYAGEKGVRSLYKSSNDQQSCTCSSSQVQGTHVGAQQHQQQQQERPHKSRQVISLRMPPWVCLCGRQLPLHSGSVGGQPVYIRWPTIYIWQQGEGCCYILASCAAYVPQTQFLPSPSPILAGDCTYTVLVVPVVMPRVKLLVSQVFCWVVARGHVEHTAHPAAHEHHEHTPAAPAKHQGKGRSDWCWRGARTGSKGQPAGSSCGGLQCMCAMHQRSSTDNLKAQCT